MARRYGRRQFSENEKPVSTGDEDSGQEGGGGKVKGQAKSPGLAECN